MVKIMFTIQFKNKYKALMWYSHKKKIQCLDKAHKAFSLGAGKFYAIEQGAD